MDFDNAQAARYSIFVDPEERKRNRRILAAACAVAATLAVFAYVWVNFLHELAFPSVVGRWELVGVSEAAEFAEAAEQIVWVDGGQEWEFFDDGTGVIISEAAGYIYGQGGRAEQQHYYFAWEIRSNRMYVATEGDNVDLYYKVSRSELILGREFEYPEEGVSYIFRRIEED